MWASLCLAIAAAGVTTLAQSLDCSELGLSGGVSQPFTGSIILYLMLLVSWLTTYSESEFYSICLLHHGMYIYAGSNLPLCRSDSQQCCSVGYVERVQERVQRRLETFLRREFRDVIDDYQDEIDNLLECEL